MLKPTPTAHSCLEAVEVLPKCHKERLSLARTRLREAAEYGIRIRVYQLALDLDMSEYHFAREFRGEFGWSPHVFYDEVRAARARDLLRQGFSQSETARRIGYRRPAELRRLLMRRRAMGGMAEVRAAETGLANAANL